MIIAMAETVDKHAVGVEGRGESIVSIDSEVWAALKTKATGNGRWRLTGDERVVEYRRKRRKVKVSARVCGDERWNWFLTRLTQRRGRNSVYSAAMTTRCLRTAIRTRVARGLYRFNRRAGVWTDTDAEFDGTGLQVFDMPRPVDCRWIGGTTGARIYCTGVLSA